MTLRPVDFGVGYAKDGFTETIADPVELQRLARLVRIGGKAHDSYHYWIPQEESDDNEYRVRPCSYPLSLDEILRPGLRECSTWDQAWAVVELKASQISLTRYSGPGRRATEEELEWAHLVFAGSRAHQFLNWTPGHCTGCNQHPCRCFA